MTLRYRCEIILLAAALMIGCSQPQRGGPREKTFPVTGVVEVDGEATEGIEVSCHPEPGSSAIKYPVTTFTDANGAFSVGTYQSGDGLPEGKYTLAFKWEVPGPGTPINKLSRAYADPAKSTHKVTVEKGEKNDLGTIELSTKGPN
ncbi:MAG: hypothetical protein WCH39_02145 [Schlesneria sp.]